MLPADGRGGGGSAADMRRGVMALSTFKKRIDDLLTAFEASAGGESSVGRCSLPPTAFGSGAFPEGTMLHREYERVHERITALSKTLGLQLEAMQIAVHGVDVAFDNLEEEQRRRFHEIRTTVNEEREKVLESHLKRDNRADHTDAGY
ncbi:hypothetical protein N4P33_17920 [Streptomyces sp. 15-116A]|uniref:hypothetical protein n=1 Tax=Streptomyces sp. 15-116A TaxID=2259035 RepID=UPI0021B199A0|nr:hypothetical protein [Streptomyces sp. 15-116A]MCT7354021.1 hypothetical protein [Streptomyces sp. 15-116A]